MNSLILISLVKVLVVTCKLPSPPKPEPRPFPMHEKFMLVAKDEAGEELRKIHYCLKFGRKIR